MFTFWKFFSPVEGQTYLHGSLESAEAPCDSRGPATFQQNFDCIRLRAPTVHIGPSWFSWGTYGPKKPLSWSRMALADWNGSFMVQPRDLTAQKRAHWYPLKFFYSFLPDTTIARLMDECDW